VQTVRKEEMELEILGFCLPPSVINGAKTARIRSAPSSSFDESWESKGAIPDQELNLRTISDVVVRGEVVIPKGSSKIAEPWREAITKGKDEPQSVLAIVVDVPSQYAGWNSFGGAMSPQSRHLRNSLAGDPTYGMMHSNGKDVGQWTRQRRQYWQPVLR